MIDSTESGTPLAQINADGGHLVLDADRDDEKSGSVLGLQVDGRRILTLDTSKNSAFAGKVAMGDAGITSSFEFPVNIDIN